MEPINWGILSTGHMASKMVASLQFDPSTRLVAVASRQEDKAKKFSIEYGISSYYGSYEALISDSSVDIIYIATPNSVHYPLIIQCLEGGKHVLCEKPFTLNSRQARVCIDKAKERGLFLMEAMWTRFFPAIDLVREWLHKEVIGKIEFCTGSFHVRFPFDPQHRTYNSQLGGGALLDIGVYLISLSNYFLGSPSNIDGKGVLSPSGVDYLHNILITYPSGAHASLTAGFNCRLPREFFIGGTKGYIKIEETFYRPHKLVLYTNCGAEEYERPFESNGYVHMVRHVNECLRAGKSESSIMPLAHSLELMSSMDELRKQWGVVYPGE